MKYIFLFLISMMYIHATVPKNDELLVLHTATNAEMNAIASPAQGALIFNSDDKEVYEYDGTTWKRISSTGNETKVQSGQCIDITGVGTTADPYVATRSTPGKTQATAGLVCKQLYDTGCAMDSGMYWINPDGGSTDNAFEVYCDMTTEGGGWTRVGYASDLPHLNRWTTGDEWRWIPEDFSLSLSDIQINDIRAVSTEGRQKYVGSCQGVIHYLYSDTTFTSAFGFKFHNGDDSLRGVQDYSPEANADAVDIVVIKDECSANDSTLRETIFEIDDIRVPLINIQSTDNGNSGESFGSPLTSNPAWFR